MGLKRKMDERREGDGKSERKMESVGREMVIG